MFKRFSRIVVTAGVGLALLVPTAGPASAEEPQICYVVVVIDEMPSVTPPQNIGGTVHVGTGRWHTEQNCIGPIQT